MSIILSHSHIKSFLLFNQSINCIIKSYIETKVFMVYFTNLDLDLNVLQCQYKYLISKIY